MLIDREKLIELLTPYQSFHFNRLYYSSPLGTAAPPELAPRLVIVCSDTAGIQIGENDRRRTLHAVRGDLLFGVPGAPTGLEDHQQCHTMALVFYPQYVRVASYTLPAGDVIYYHTRKPLFQPGHLIVTALSQLTVMDEAARNAGLSTAKSLIDFTLLALKNDTAAGHGKSYSTWQQIELHLTNHPSCDLSRENIARLFRLNPSYLSVLCRHHTGKSFNAHVTSMRLTQAAILLEFPLTLDEIAERCGFTYTSYFIRTFRKQYGMTPGKFRERDHELP